MVNPSLTITGPRTPHEKANEASRKDNNSENIQVFVRCRPLDLKRNEKKCVVEIDRLRKEIRVNERLNSATDKQSRLFTYDGVFDTSVGQCEVYDHVVAPLISEVLAGYNCTVFAYGQTGTGKTYTMEGERSDYECSWQDDPKAGIVPRALDQLFETLSESTSQSQVAVSYMELYNEKLYDLLNPTDDLASLSIYEDKGGKVKIGRLAQITVTKKDEIFEILQRGSAKRQKAATKLNACSSRSHTIFTVTIRSSDPESLLAGEEVYRIGKLNLVDLAGSENIGRSGAVEKRAAEAGNINKSLLTLGRVITSLVERQNHIPYRESKLTRLLQDSLGGGTKTSIIATISPNILDVEDTLSTLDYAQRAKKIQNKPEVNQKLAKRDVLRDLEEEVVRLRKDLGAARCGTNAFVISKENYDAMTSIISAQDKGLEEKGTRITEMETQIADLIVEIAAINQLFKDKSQKLEEETEKRIRTEVTLDKTEKDLKETIQDCNEQKHLVQVHVRTEKLLKLQADQLLQVAQVSTDHVGKLHEKVARIHDLQEETVLKVEITSKSIKDQMARLEGFVCDKFDTRNLDVFDSIFNNKFNEVSDCLSTVDFQVKKFTDAVSTGIIDLSKSSKDQQVIDQFNKIIILTDDLNRLRNELRGELIQVLEENKSQCQLLLNSLIESFSTQRKAIEEELMNLSQQLTLSARAVKGEVASMESIMVNILKNRSKELESKRKEVESAKNQVLKSSDCEMSQIVLMEEFMIKAFRKLRENKTLSASTIVSSLQPVSEDLTQFSQQLQEESKKIVATITEVNKNVEQSRKANSAIVDQLEYFLTRNHQSNVNMVVGASSQVDMQCETLLTSIDDIHAKVSTQLEDLVALERSVLADLKSSIETRKCSLSDLDSKVKEQAQPLSDSVKEVVRLVADSHASIDNEIYSTKLHLDSAQKNVVKELESLEEQFELLASKELKRYQPTGETPQKTTFSYPTDLVETSPHEGILRRFRGQESSQIAPPIITDLPESTSRLSSGSSTGSLDSCGTNCSSSSASNVENKIPNEAKSKIANVKKSKEKADKSEIAIAVKKRQRFI